ncbi:pyruvate carboxyltransferase [Mycolicibacterium smegmatis]|uniref:3-hydroxy-3-methylglutaryl-CoA lyase n=1 Tax=Mycolicibacterium smegmatis (strain MKD8) TaxID=1214915 RepID=A0A2U9PKB5_MYCSE|nr:pyruvate carboxyltransferase [Mycolicibacterium smegmatis]AWT52190.1 3-hydroxy-3-methylglutaryl-CoA lyase [Mycolicibacterium smegmatis MKD8]
MLDVPLPLAATVVEVGLRDGLQAVESVMSTEVKLQILDGLLAAGFTNLEITSFAHPRVLPQFADAELVVARAPRRPGVTYKALAPNLKGALRALDTSIDEIVMVVPVDAETAQRNQNATPAQLLSSLTEIVGYAHRSGKRVSAAIATAFFAPCRGPVESHELETVIRSVADAGVNSLYLAGTSGMETPTEFQRGIKLCKTLYPHLPVGVHLHNRNGFGPINAVASLIAGADWIEASFGGLGGDLWFPGDKSVLGNAPMEDILNLLHSIDITTGIDLDRYLEVVRHSEEATGMESRSFLSRGGTRDEVARAEWPI